MLLHVFILWYLLTASNHIFDKSISYVVKFIEHKHFEKLLTSNLFYFDMSIMSSCRELNDHLK